MAQKLVKEKSEDVPVKGFFDFSDELDLEEKTVSEINVGFFYPSGGTTGEFSIKWRKLDGDIVPRLYSYDDSWLALSKMPELIEFMAKNNDKNISKEEFVSGLKELGYVNLTKKRKKDEIGR